MNVQIYWMCRMMVAAGGWFTLTILVMRFFVNFELYCDMAS